MSRASLATRIAALGIAVAIVTGILAGALAVGLIGSAQRQSAKQTLARVAGAAATAEDAGTFDRPRIRAVLQVLRMRAAVIPPSGPLPAGVRILRPAQIADVRAGGRVSTTVSIGGHDTLVEARPTRDGGGIVVVQRIADATAAGAQAIRRTLLAILVGVAVAAGLGALVARRMARPLRRTAAAAHALAAGSRDVTLPRRGPAEVVEVADAVGGLADALTRAEGRQREFLLSVSHDLRTPLTAITGYAESLSHGVIPTGEVGEVGAIMLGEARRLERMVADLLDLARLDADEITVQFLDVDLAVLVREAASAWTGRCEQAGIDLRVEATTAPCRTDPQRLRQILDGLVENALRVTPAGAPIVLAARTDGATAVAEVRDGGPGLTDDDLAVAFERSELHRRYRGRRAVGSGLGLAIVQRIAHRLGGGVEAG
ncbi:MAG: HAMP domain-containing histidine kinase, partial [Jatrophihabitans sp.]